jgi:endonuclease-3 related protein
MRSPCVVLGYGQEGEGRAGNRAREKRKENVLMAVQSSNRIVLMALFEALLKAYGKRNWWPAKTRFEVIVGAILTQNVSWRNARIGIQKLEEAGLLSAEAILATDCSMIADKVRSTRFYNQKAIKLQSLCRHLLAHHGGSLDSLFSADRPVDEVRKELLSIKGIGEETADSILLYAGGRLSFVSDSYTRRLLDRYGFINGLNSYGEIRQYFMDNLPPDLYVYGEFHALIDRHGHATCKSRPRCSDCPVRAVNSLLRCAYAEGSGGD